MESDSEPPSVVSARAACALVHAVTTDAIALSADFPDRAREVMRALGARGALHLRAPLAGGRRLHALAASLVDEARASGCALVVNDRLDVAIAAGADGVQLTSRSMGPEDARRAALRAGEVGARLAIGASVHDLEEARAAVAAGADWLVAGHVFPTPSHAGAPGRGIAFLRAVAAAVPCPVIGIGGVLPRHLPLLIAAGARGAAVIRGIWDADHPARAASDYLTAYDADDRA